MRAFDKWRFRVKPQKIIFLDIDGVLNSMELFDKLEERDMEPFMGIDVDEDNLEQLRYIVERTGAQIVLSSSWRHAWHEKRADDQGRESIGSGHGFLWPEGLYQKRNISIKETVRWK